MYKKLPYEIEDLDPETNEKICQDSSVLPKLIRVGPGKMLASAPFRDYAWEYYNFELREDDVIIAGFPRSGTTMIQEIAWLLCNKLDFERAKNIHYSIRVPFFEGKSVMSEILTNDFTNSELSKAFVNSLEILRDMKTGPRVLKTHLHFQLLPPALFEKGCKVIYIARDPRDVAVSMYHLENVLTDRDFNKGFKTFFERFKNNLLMFTPYWAHIKQGWDKRNEKNFKFLFYEDLNTNLRRYVEEIAEFLEKDCSPGQLDKLSETLQFDNFKTYINAMNPRLDKQAIEFVRIGKIGGWKYYFDEEMNSEAEKWISENAQRIGIRYPFGFDKYVVNERNC